MPVRIYDIAKKLGIESKEVLAKAKELGISTARVPSSSLDKITAEFLEGHFMPLKPVPPPAPAPPPVSVQPIVLVTAPPPPAPPEKLEAPEPVEAGSSVTVKEPPTLPPRT